MSKKVVIINPEELPVVSSIEGDLKSMQEVVQGHIELFWTTESGVDLFCNEEGKINHMQPNRYIPEMEDLIFGPILAISHDDEGDSMSLTDEQVAEIVDMFTNKYPASMFFFDENHHIISIKLDFD